MKLGERIYQLKEIHDLSWPEIYLLFSEYEKHSLRARLHEYKKSASIASGKSLSKPEIVGKTASDDIPDGAEVFRAVVSSQQKAPSAKKNGVSTVTFDDGPVCIVCMADLHLGSQGTDYGLLDRDLEIIESSPATYIGLAGDLVDNFIIGTLAALQMHSNITIREEYALARYVLERIKDRLVWSVLGNHESWTRAVAGVDFFASIHNEIAPHIIYDRDEANIDVSVGESTYRWRVRHKWRGSSQYNPTHGIEKTAKFDAGNYFDIGVGAHTHVSGLAREFNNGGKTALAVLCGAYKRDDEYARRLGLPQPNSSTAVAVVLEEDGFWATSNLKVATNYMRTVHE